MKYQIETNMKRNLLFILPLLFIFAACKTDNNAEPSVKLSPSSISTNSVASTTTLSVVSNYDWTLLSDQTWCVPSVTSGKAGVTATTTISIAANTSTLQRTANLAFNVNKATITTATCTQAAEEKYKLPVIFHVLYHTSTDALQHVTQAQISKIMSAVNTLYSNNNMNLEFDLATADPNGNALSEAGIDRQYISTDSLECDKFMNGDLIDNSKYVSMLWNLNKYINVFLYEFKTDNSGYVTMGITHLPYVSSTKTLTGLTVGDYYLTHNWEYPHCASINSSFIYEYDPTSGYYNPYDVSVTIAHELGHYLGLFHVFTEVGATQCSGNDYCGDTPNYDRSTYEKWLINYIQTHKDLTLSDLLPRTNCETSATFNGDNIMDYEYCKSDAFTTDQRARIRFILNYGLFIPGTKFNSSTVTSSSKALGSSAVRPPILYESIGTYKGVVKSFQGRKTTSKK